jgi:peptidylprolyl isomerase
MTNTTTATKGCEVSLHYRGTFEDGEEFDSSYSRDTPMDVTLGAGTLIAGFDEALHGMSEGETKTFTLTPDQAYGPRDPDATVELNKSIFPEEFEFTTGMTIPLTGPGNKPFLATLVESRESDIVVDVNHPMAGKTLTFEVKVLTVTEPTTTEDDTTTTDETT